MTRPLSAASSPRRRGELAACQWWREGDCSDDCRPEGLSPEAEEAMDAAADLLAYARAAGIALGRDFELEELVLAELERPTLLELAAL